MVIQFDSQQLAEDFLLSDSQIKNLMDFSIKEITASFAKEWEKVANQKLVTSRSEYVQSIIVIDEGWGKGAVVLRGWLPNAVEEGITAFDMKTSLLSGPNVKTTKTGTRYNSIPFKHGTPGTLAENFNGGILPEEVYQVVRTQSVDKPIVKDQLPKAFQELKVHSVGSPEAKNFKQYQHKNSIYEGITKKQDSVTGQSSYISFRRVSDNSDPNSWQNPGIEAHHLAEQALNDFNIPVEAGKAVDNFLKSIGWQ